MKVVDEDRRRSSAAWLPIIRLTFALASLPVATSEASARQIEGHLSQRDRTPTNVAKECDTTQRASREVRLGTGKQLVYVEPQAVAFGQGRLLALGSPVMRNQMSVAMIGRKPAAGAIISPDGRASIVPMPPGTQRMFAPRIFYQAGSGWHVLWIETAQTDSPRVSQPGVLMYARFDGTDWSLPQRVSSSRSFLTNPTLPSQVVPTREGFALAVPIHRELDSAIVVWVREAGQWREAPVSMARRALYATLVESRGQLVLVYAGRTPDDRVALITTRSHDGARTWSTPTVVTFGSVFEPTVLAGERQLTLVWIDAQSTNNPRGARIAFSRDLGDTWTAPASVLGADEATSVAAVRVSGDWSLVFPTTAGPRRAQDLVVIGRETQKLLARDSVVGKAITIVPVAASKREVFALWNTAEPTATAMLPKLFLLRLRLSCEPPW